MTSTTASTLGPALVAVVHEVWESFMLPAPETVGELPQLDHTLVTAASVCLSGAWDGVVIVECPPPLATALSAAMLGMGEDEVSEMDVADTMGEIANMVGGNLKNSLPDPTLLSLPVVAQSMSPSLVKDAEPVCRLGFTWQGGPLRIVVWSAQG